MKNPETLGYFFECYFYQSVDNIELDDVICNFKSSESSFVKKQLINECGEIIKSGNYTGVIPFIRQHGSNMKLHSMELFVKYLRNRLTDTPTEMTPYILWRIKT